MLLEETLQQGTSPRVENPYVKTKSSTQEGNIAGRDIAGGDITHEHRYNTRPPSTLRELAEKLRLDTDAEAQQDFISQLQHYAEPTSNKPSRNLQQKLQDASRVDLLSDALKWKEQFSKKLLKLQFSLQAQNLFVHILSKIHTYFSLKIRPKVIVGAPRAEIDDLVYELILELYGEVGNSELDLTMNDLQGMVYFLAGNCHIDWS